MKQLPDLTIASFVFEKYALAQVVNLGEREARLYRTKNRQAGPKAGSEVPHRW